MILKNQILSKILDNRSIYIYFFLCTLEGTQNFSCGKGATQNLYIAIWQYIKNLGKVKIFLG